MIRNALRRTLLLALAVLLCACSSSPPAPDWQVNARSSLDRATDAYLEGNSRVASVEFTRARAELARTGDPALVARAELTACAARVASLEFDDCPAFAPLALDAGADLQAYARYLAGSSRPDDVDRLPAQHRAVAAGMPAAAAVGSIADPLARLVAAGVALRRGGGGPALADLAVETASKQGWRRPLLAWLTLQQRAAAATNDTDAAARLQRRIDLLAPAAAAGAAPSR